MSQQQRVAGAESGRAWAWLAAPDSAAGNEALPAANFSPAPTQRSNRGYVVGAADPSEDPIEPWRRIQERLDPLLSTPEQQADFPAAMEALALDVLQRVGNDPDLAILSMLRLDSFDYAVGHALQTAVVCDVYGHSAGTPVEQRVVLIQAALTMNIAMLELQRELEWQSNPPTPEQRRQINEHPQRGRERLETLGVRNQAWLRAVAEHHESPDGSGYPTGCLRSSCEADLLAIADRFCALLSRRGVRDSMSGDRVVQSLYSAARGRRQSLANRLIELFGDHPPGSLVRLVNGEIGIVTRRSNTFQSEQVCALASAAGEPLPEPLLRNTGEPVHVIVGSVSEREFKGMIDYVALQRLMSRVSF